MEHYISKSALVAELKKRISDYWSDSENTMGIYPYALEEVIKYVDTLEVKEVDLETSISLTWEDIDWIVGEAVCRVSEDSEAEQICKEVLKRFKAQKGKNV